MLHGCRNTPRNRRGGGGSIGTRVRSHGDGLGKERKRRQAAKGRRLLKEAAETSGNRGMRKRIKKKTLSYFETI